jgi:hypothetical protein
VTAAFLRCRVRGLTPTGWNPALVIVLMTLLIFPFGAIVLGEDLCPDPTLVETAGKRERHGLFRTNLRESINLGWVRRTWPEMRRHSTADRLRLSRDT